MRSGDLTSVDETDRSTRGRAAGRMSRGSNAYSKVRPSNVPSMVSGCTLIGMKVPSMASECALHGL
jgi:hypothetical protein